MDLIKNLLLWIWQLPQNLIGYIWSLFQKKYQDPQKLEEIKTLPVVQKVDPKIFLQKNRGSVTFGNYIFIYYLDFDYLETSEHECGHVIQSKWLGPLYLFVIGIPSILHCCWNNWILCCIEEDGTKNYGHFYTEKWANKIIENLKQKN